MANRIRLRDARPKAFWGALIGAATSVAGSLISANQQKKAAEEQKRQQQLADDRKLAANMTQVMALNQNAQRAYEDQFRTNFRLGGRPKCGLGWLGKGLLSSLPAIGQVAGSIVDGALANNNNTIAPIDTNTETNEEQKLAYGGKTRPTRGAVVQRGGVAQPIGYNTFLLRGMSHDDTNSKGQSGIYLNLNGRDVEAEGGEILHKNGNQFEIISDRIGYGGQSYADHVLNGENPGNIFNMQENSKRRRLRNGGTTSPVGRRCAALGDAYPPYASWFDIDPGLWTRELSATDRYPQRNWFVAPTFTQARADRVTLTNPPRLGSNSRLAVGIPSNYDFLKTQADIDYENRVRQDMQNRVAADMTGLVYNNTTGGLEAAPTATTVEQTLPSNRLGMSLTPGDWINTGIGVLGSIFSNSIMQRSLRNMSKYAPSAPTPYQAGKLVTTFNINPQRAELARQRQQNFKAIKENTASSAAAIEKQQLVNTATTDAENKLWGQKFNTEAEMLNRDTLNRQQVANMTVHAYNDWRNRLTDYNRGLGQARAASNVAMIQGIGDSVSGLIESGMNNYNRDLDRRALAAASEQGTVERLINFGYPLDQQTYASIAINSKNEDARRLAYSKLTRKNQRRLRNGGLYVS